MGDQGSWVKIALPGVKRKRVGVVKLRSGAVVCMSRIFLVIFSLAKGVGVNSLRVRFSFVWRAVGAPVLVRRHLFRGNCRKGNVNK